MPKIDTSATANNSMIQITKRATRFIHFRNYQFAGINNRLQEPQMSTVFVVLLQTDIKKMLLFRFYSTFLACC